MVTMVSALLASSRVPWVHGAPEWHRAGFPGEPGPVQLQPGWSA